MSTITLGRRMAVVLPATLLALASCLILAASARADFGISDFAVSFHDPTGTPVTQAGAHADITTSFTMNSANDPTAGTVPDGSLKGLQVDLPVGFYGNPRAVPECTAEEFTRPFFSCAGSSQVGVIHVQTGPDASDPNSFYVTGVYNLVPVDGETAAFGATIVGAPVRISITAPAAGGYRLRATLHGINQGLPIYGTSLTLWGVPADPSHDAERYSIAAFPPGSSSSDPVRPFLSTPPSCLGSVPDAAVHAVSWQQPTHWVDGPTSSLPAMTGCDQLRFNGSLTMQPATSKIDSPSAFDTVVSIPQDGSAAGLATPELRNAQVTLPAGVSISPSSADGLQACSDAQLGLGDDDATTCPDASKIGSVALTTPVLADTLQGDIVLRSPTDTDLFRIALVIPGPGLLLKIPGIVHADDTTGQLTAVFDDAPALPFSEMRLHFNGGTRAPLATPMTCGTKTTDTELTSWAGATSSSSDSFDISADGAGAACPATAPFTPSVAAGTTNPLAGAFSPFTLTVRRADGDQILRSLAVDMPSGLLAAVGSVPLCGEADAAAGTCGAASQIGTTTVQAGPGAHPFSLTGKVFLGGPYKGRPFNLSIVVRAIAGPFDLGTVVVRAPVSVDAANAKISVPSDPLPTILKGVPLRLRTINLALDRPGFTFNATSCSPMAIGASVASDTGAVAASSSRYQALGCAGLPFAPRMTASTNGKLAFKQGAAFKVHIGANKGDAAIRAVAVTLPKELPSRLVPTINNACLVAQFDADYKKCPEDSYVGTVTASTPILPQPLTGPAYIVAHPHDKPTISLLLFGQGIGKGINLQLDGTIIIDSGGGRTQVTFGKVPDVPITSFDLDLPAGPHSALDAPLQNLCKGGLSLAERVTGQNGKVLEATVPVTVGSCPKIAKVKVSGFRLTGRTLGMQVKAPAPGLMTVGGTGVERLSRRADRPLTYHLSTRLTARERRILAKRRVTLRATVTFKPDNAATSSSVVKTITVGPPKTTKRKHRR
jgi:hypothetical protein